MPNAYVPPAKDGRTKLNLILGSANQRLDVFQDNWGDYKEVALPINDLLDQYGPNVKRALWQEVGWGTILYLAAISNLDPQHCHPSTRRP